MMKTRRATILALLVLLGARGPSLWASDESRRAAQELFQQAVEARDVRVQIALYSAALKLDPLYRNACYNLANAYWDNGQLDEAVEAFHKAIEIDATYLNAHWNLAIVLQKLGKLEDALAEWRAARDLATDTSDQQTLAIHVRYLEDLLADQARRATAQAPFQGAVYLKDGDLYLAELGDPQHTEKRLTEFGNITFALVSPSRTLVACLRGRQRLITYDLSLSRLRDHAVEARGPIIDLEWSPAHPDRLAFIRTSRDTPGPDGDVFVLDVRMDNLTQITTDGYNRALTWAPSGDRLALVKGGAQGEVGLVVLSLADRTESPVAPATEGVRIHRPRWSPDGRRIAFLRISAQGEGSLSVIAADGSNIRDSIAFVRETDFDWWPDGNMIVYQSDPARGTEGVWAYDLITGKSQVIVSGPGLWDFAVASDLPPVLRRGLDPAAVAAWEQNVGLGLMTLEEFNDRVWEVQPRNPVIVLSPLPTSPDVPIPAPKIWLVHLDTGERMPLVALQEATYGFDVTWSTSGPFFAFVLRDLGIRRQGLDPAAVATWEQNVKMGVMTAEEFDGRVWVREPGYDIVLLQADPKAPDPRHLVAGIKPQRGSPLLLGLIGRSPEQPGAVTSASPNQ